MGNLIKNTGNTKQVDYDSDLWEVYVDGENTFNGQNEIIPSIDLAIHFHKSMNHPEMFMTYSCHYESHTPWIIRTLTVKVDGKSITSISEVNKEYMFLDYILEEIATVDWNEVFNSPLGLLESDPIFVKINTNQKEA